MFARYLLVLFVTISVYYTPIGLVGFPAWVASSTISLLYILFIWHISKIRERWFIISVETTAMICSIIAFLSYYPTNLQKYMSPESQWFWINYESIMGYCFLIEIVAILFGIVKSGEFKRVLSLCFTFVHDDKRSYSTLLFSEKHLCPSTSKVLQMR